jgi:hypothetical protein
MEPSCDDNCEIKIQLKFCTKGTFSQELVAMSGSTDQFIPATGDNGNIYAVLQLEFSKGLSALRYKLYVFNATQPDDKIILAHLHFGPSNVNGPILVSLYPSEIPVNVNGLLIKGTIYNSNIIHYNGGTNPQNQINSVASIYAAIRLGNIYFNVHSQKFPGGTARGQIYLDSI